MAELDRYDLVLLKYLKLETFDIRKLTWGFYEKENKDISLCIKCYSLITKRQRITIDLNLSLNLSDSYNKLNCNKTLNVKYNGRIYNFEGYYCCHCKAFLGCGYVYFSYFTQSNVVDFLLDCIENRDTDNNKLHVLLSFIHNTSDKGVIKNLLQKLIPDMPWEIV